jgi:hypothetical protein
MKPPMMLEEDTNVIEDESEDSDDEMKDELIQRPQDVFEKLTLPMARNFFNARDPLTLSVVRQKADNGYYRTLMDARVDLFRILRIIGKNDVFVIKENDDRLNMSFYSHGVAKTKLSSIVLWMERSTPVTLWHAVYNLGWSDFSVQRSSFRSQSEDVFSIFAGYNILTGPTPITLLPLIFDKLVYEGVSNSSPIVYEYLLNWIARLTQNPGLRNETCLVFTGVEGTGKTMFTDTVCRMIAPYAEENLDMNDIMGKFNSIIVGKILIVVNEVDTIGSARAAEKLMNKAKRLITDTMTTIEEKYVSKMTTENTANLILVSNSPAPVVLSLTDRRYFVIRVNTKFLKRIRFFTLLDKARNHPSFYSHLLTFFLSRDISGFNPRIIPMTKAKRNLTIATMTDVDVFIQRHYRLFTSPRGFSYKEMHASIPRKQQGDPMFMLNLRSRCSCRKLGTGPHRFRAFFLRPEYIDKFKQLL